MGEQEDLVSVHDVLGFLSDFDGLLDSPCYPINFPADNCRLFPVDDVIFCVNICDRRFVPFLVLLVYFLPLCSGDLSYGLQNDVPSIQCRLSGSFCMESCERRQLYLLCLLCPSDELKGCSDF